MAGYPYIAKIGKVINYTIVAVNTWEKVASQVKGCRGWWIQTNIDTDNPFRLAFVAAPTEWLTSDGRGWTFDNTEIPDVYVYTPTVGTKFEICYWL